MEGGFLSQLLQTQDADPRVLDQVTVDEGKKVQLGSEDVTCKEGDEPKKKRAKTTSQKPRKTSKGGKAKSKTSKADAGSSDEEEGTKRGPNWKDHWVVNLIHLRGTMHEKFSGMKKQGDVLYILICISINLVLRWYFSKHREF
jgi:hypothetical protein